MSCLWFMESPVGELGIAENEEKITCIFFGGRKEAENAVKGYKLDRPEEKKTPILDRAVRQLEEYFAGERKSFDLPLAPSGTPFQERVWDALTHIPYGETRTYGEIAAEVGNPRAGRAVGMANHRNPISIVIPCHRVIGADGSLTGYGGGLDIKRRLLELEKQMKEKAD